MKRVAILLLFVFSICHLKAQNKHGFSVFSAQHFAIQKKNLDEQKPANSQHYSLGGGHQFGLNYHFFPDSSNWYFQSGFDFLNGNYGTYFLHKTDSTEHGISRKTNSLRFNACLNYSFNLGKGNFLDLGSGVVLPLITNSHEVKTYHSSDSFYRIKNNIKHYLSLGYRGTLRYRAKLHSKFDFLLSAEWLILQSKVKSSKVAEYSDYRGRSLEESYPYKALRETDYFKNTESIRNNESVLPALFNRSEAYQKLSYTESFSSFGLKVGFLFYLN